jgi:hypothetical protein
MIVSASHPRSRRWIGFFLVLAVLAAAAVILPIVYNLSIQLRPEQLAAARQRWNENAPADYDLAYLVKHSQEGGEPTDTEYFVEVRGGRTVLVMADSEVIYLDPALAVVAGPGVLVLSSDRAERYGVTALFDQIEAALRQDESAARRNFATARFDPRDGHPYHYVHRMRGTKERIEWNVKLTRLNAK